MYSLYVYDKTFQRIGLVEQIKSLQWLSLYADAGEVKLICAASDKNRALLQRGMRLWCTEQTESAVITQDEIDDNGKTATLTVRAPLSIARWKKRVVMGTVLIKNIESAMLKIAEDNRRGLHGQTASVKGISASTDSQTSWGNVLDAEASLAAAHGLGFREVFDPVTGEELFEVYQGTDRTVEGSDAFVGYFGDDVGNISNVRIKDSETDWYNVAVVAGQGEGADRKVEIVSLGIVTGEERRELWVDAKDIACTYQVAQSDAALDDEGNLHYTYEQHSYTDEEYAALLRIRGLEKLLEHIQIFEVTVEAEQNLMQYGVDYFLGDLVPVKLTRYGLRLSARLTGVQTIYEASGRRIILQLSDIQFQTAIKGGTLYDLLPVE